MNVEAVLKATESLSADEHIELIARLWDRLPEDWVPDLEPAELAELERRAGEADANPHEGATIDDVIARRMR